MEGDGRGERRITTADGEDYDNCSKTNGGCNDDTDADDDKIKGQTQRAANQTN